MSRVIFWWSHGSTSTTAVDLGIPLVREMYPDYEIEIVCIQLEEEHESNHTVILPQYDAYFRITYGVGIKSLTNKKYKGESGFGSVDEVIRKTRYMSGVAGARCTKELKKQVRLDYQRHDDVHVFGFHVNEAHRIDQILDTENELNIYAPLVELGLNKQDALNHIGSLGFQIPVMYKLGYNNNNCIGCLKASGAGYWNKIRVDFPDVFETRSRQEYLLGTSLVSISANKFAQNHPEYMIKMLEESANPDIKYKVSIKSNGQLRLPLRFLPPDLGDHKTEHQWDCGIFCELDGE